MLDEQHYYGHRQQGSEHDHTRPEDNRRPRTERLILAGGGIRVAEHLGLSEPQHDPPGGAQLVFLNACMSGEFRSGLGGEVDGFWQAFLAGSTASLVATLAYVHPRYA